MQTCTYIVHYICTRIVHMCRHRVIYRYRHIFTSITVLKRMVIYIEKHDNIQRMVKKIVIYRKWSKYTEIYIYTYIVQTHIHCNIHGTEW